MEDLLSTVQSVSLTGYIVLTMAAMGMKLSMPDVLATLKQRRLIGLSLLVNMVAIPILAGIALLVFEMPDAAVIGIVLLASAAGYAPIMSANASGSLPFSTTLIFLFSTVSVLTVPITASLLIGGQTDVSVDPWSIIRTLVLFQLIPLGAGLLFRRAREGTADGWAPGFARVAQLAVLVAVATYIIDILRADGSPLIDLGWQAYVAWALITAAGIGLGYVSGGPAERTRRTLALHTAIRNVGLALLIAAQSFEGLGAEVAILAMALVMYPMAIAVMAYWQRQPAPAVDSS